MYENLYQLLQPIKEREQGFNVSKFKSMFSILFGLLIFQFFLQLAKIESMQIIYDISLWGHIIWGIIWIMYWIGLLIGKTRFVYGIFAFVSAVYFSYISCAFFLPYIVEERKPLAVRMAIGVILTIMSFVILLQVIMVIYKIKAGHYAFGKINVKIYIPVTFIGAVVASLVPLTFFGFRKNAGNILGKDWAMVYVIYAFAVLFAVSSRYLIHLIIYQFANFKLTDEEYEKLGSPKENRRHFELQEKAKEEARKKKQMEDVKEETNDEYEN